MAKKQQITAKEAAAMITDGMTIMVGGFLTNGTPEAIIDAIVEKGVKDLTVIGNDAGLPGKGIGKLVENRLVKKLIVSHVGLTPIVAQLSNNNELILELVPQGTLAEKIRSGGAGLGGVLTPTGIGTIVAEGKEVITVDDREYLLEKPLKADVALIKAYQADESGNLRYKGSTRNFNPIMATAAELVIAESDNIVESGTIGPDYVETPGLFVDYITGGSKTC